MDDLLTIFLIVVFFVIPLLEGVLKKRRGSGAPPDAGPGAEGRPRPETRRPAEAAGTASAGRGGEARTSEGLIPPEVWEQLTGQPAPGRAPAERAPAERAPEPEPVRVPERSPVAERAPLEDRRPGPDHRPTPEGARRAGSDAPPGELRTGSLAVAREEIGGARGAEVGSRRGIGKRRPVPAMGSGAYGRGGGSGSAAERLVDGIRAGAPVEELRRAIVYREVLGPPVGLRDSGRDESRPG